MPAAERDAPNLGIMAGGCLYVLKSARLVRSWTDTPGWIRLWLSVDHGLLLTV